MPEEGLARAHAPAGLDLGKVAHEEIAVAILAELVRERAAGRLAAAPPAEIPRHEALDPVCGMTVDVAGAKYSATFEGTTFYFCSAGCLHRFEQDPARFAAAPA
jgi:xanthine dehydrogenase accessory factor